MGRLEYVFDNAAADSGPEYFVKPLFVAAPVCFQSSNVYESASEAGSHDNVAEPDVAGDANTITPFVFGVVSVTLGMPGTGILVTVTKKVLLTDTFSLSVAMIVTECVPLETVAPTIIAGVCGKVRSTVKPDPPETEYETICGDGPRESVS